MQLITITGGRTLHGRIRPAAAKNSVLPLLAATLLCRTPSRLRAVPPLADVATSLALLQSVGARPNGRGVTCSLPPAKTCKGRFPTTSPGPCAARCSTWRRCSAGGRGAPAAAGGCKLGPRPVDIHLAGLAAMGAQVELEGIAVTLRRRGPLHGVDFALRLPSVGATMTLMMAATQAGGTTILRGAACEPEICDLANFLRACGAHITGAGTPVVVIQGGKPLQGTAWTPLPDRIAAATYAAALACAGGEVTVTHCAPAYYAAFLDFLQAAGVDVARQDTTVTLARSPARPLRGGQTLCANAWPAFATDTAPLAAAVLLTADAPSEIYDHLFARRFACAEGFAALGAGCRTAGRTLYMDGRAALHGAAVTAPDLRGGAALLLAALGAEGVTLLRDPGHIPRGYADLPGDLRTLGADCITEKT